MKKLTRKDIKKTRREDLEVRALYEHGEKTKIYQYRAVIKHRGKKYDFVDLYKKDTPENEIHFLEAANNAYLRLVEGAYEDR